MGNENSKLAAELNLHHGRLTALCTVLEAIADALPQFADKQQCLAVARYIVPTVKEAHVFEEEKLFPQLKNLSTANPQLEQSLERLRFEHWEDESYAEEICEILREFGTGALPQGSDKLSYMLRGFFEGLRRHMAFEAEHLAPMLTQSR